MVDIHRQEPVEKLKKNTPLIIVRPLEGTRPQSTFMPLLSQSRGHPDTMNLTELPLGAAVCHRSFFSCKEKSKRGIPWSISAELFTETGLSTEIGLSRGSGNFVENVSDVHRGIQPVALLLPCPS